MNTTGETMIHVPFKQFVTNELSLLILQKLIYIKKDDLPTLISAPSSLSAQHSPLLSMRHFSHTLFTLQIYSPPGVGFFLSVCTVNDITIAYPIYCIA